MVTEIDYTSNGTFFHNPWKLCPVTRIEEVKMVIKLLPIWATTIIFWTTYAQMITFSVEQASTMNRTMGHFQIPAGSLTVFFVGAILITLAVYDRVIMPLWKKWKGKPGIITKLTFYHNSQNSSSISITITSIFILCLRIQQPTKDRNRTLLISSRNDMRSSSRSETFISSKRFQSIHHNSTNLSLHPDPSILPCGVRRSVYIHRSARLLHHTITKRNENNEYRPVPHNAFARILLKQPFGFHCEGCDWKSWKTRLGW